MPRTNLWFNTHTKRYDFHPEAFKLQKKCFKCNLDFEQLDGKEVMLHYYQNHRMWTVIVCDVCGLPFVGKKEVQAHKYISHAH